MEGGWAQRIFEIYREDQRHATLPGFIRETLHDATRYAPADGEGEALVCFARFDAATADARIEEELKRIRDGGWDGEWKVHDLDTPADLKARLEGRGLRGHHVEALMVLDVASAPLAAPSCGTLVIEEARGAALDEIAAFQEEVWQCSLPWLARAMHELAADGSTLVLCARDAGRIVGSGWIEFAEGSLFAQIHGGAVLAPYRGRGVYSTLYERRLQEAKRRGVRWIAVDAAPMSRPILEKKGFRFVCNTHPMRTRPHDAKAVTRA